MSSGSCSRDKHRAGFHIPSLVPSELAPSFSQLLTPCSILKHDLPHAGVWALLLEATHPKLATDVFYVAGDRVVADSLCKPFSMGRNLFCVHSRKHLDDIPELKESKQRTNRKTLTEMSRALNQVLSTPPAYETSAGLLRAATVYATWGLQASTSGSHHVCIGRHGQLRARQSRRRAYSHFPLSFQHGTARSCISQLPGVKSMAKHAPHGRGKSSGCMLLLLACSCF